MSWIAGVLAAAALLAPPAAPHRRAFAELKAAVTLKVGAAADWVQIAGGSVWVGSRGPDAVRRIDPASNRIIASVPLPGAACSGMTSAFGALWVPICGPGGGLGKIDLRTARLQAVYPVGAAVREGGVAAGAGSLWMPRDGKGHLMRIDPRTGRVRQVLGLCPGAENPAFSRGSLWVTCSERSGLERISGRTGRVLGITPTGPRPRFLAAGPTSIWTLNQGDGSLTRIDPRTARVRATIPLGTPGPGGDVQLGGGRLWTTLAGTPLSMVDPATDTLERQWAGKGGDSLNYGFGSVWLTDYDRGVIQRFRRADLVPRKAPPSSRRGRSPSATAP